MRRTLALGALLSLALSVMAQTYTFSDGGKQTRVEFAPNEAYFRDARAAAQLKAKSSKRAGEAGVVVTFTKPARDAVKGVRQAAAPVFYDSDERHSEGSRRILTNKLLVRIDNPDKWSALQESTGAKNHKASLIKGWDLIEYADAYAALDAVEVLTKAGGWEFTPVFARQFSARQAAASATGPLQRAVNDPLFANEWHLNNDGPGIRMNAAWDISTGKGVNVAVVDDGLEVAHEDLAANAYPLESGYHRNFNSGDPANPTPSKPSQTHGTNCAGLIAAVGFNNIGVIGVAPEARLMGLRLIAEPADDDATAAALSWQPDGLITHVSSNSWGPPDDGKSLGRMSALQAAAIEKAATTYRDGLGTVFCVSAGNGRQAGDDSSYDAFAGSRFVIGVGAVNRKGEPSSFSEQGMNVAISALGGEFNPPDVLWTTNVSGADALAYLKSNFDSTQAMVNYSDAFNGTSAAAPQVSGAAALLLQANPKLGYRDVKEILMKSATKDGLKNGDDFKDNGGGFSFSHSFGAGLLNVSAALDLAATWTNLGPLANVSAASTDVKDIPDGTIDGAVFSFDFSGAQPLRVESVEVTVNVQHANRGDIGFVLTSPSGMMSIANNRSPDDGQNFQDYTFTSVRHWGEKSAGVWTVRVIDIRANGVAGRAGNISMKIYGTAKQN